jgi:subtilisin family serine protease
MQSVSASDRYTIITGIKLAPVGAALVLTASLALAACGGGGGGSSPTPTITVPPTITPTATPSPGSTPTANPQAFVCPATQNSLASVRTSSQSVHRLARTTASTPSTPAYTQLAISYSRGLSSTALSAIAARETAYGATYLRTHDFDSQSMRVVSVPTAKVAQVEAQFRATSGVMAVGVTGQRRMRMTTTALITNDSYFKGVTPANVAPYYESSTSPGQWDMHAIGLDHAFGYSQPGTGYTPTNNALGSSSIKIAIIDTGEDATHPELGGKIVRQRCFITNLANVQNSSNFAVDEDGHGTDVSGIAAASTNNSLGFASAGGAASIMAYRVFPTPDDNCANSNSNDSQCSSDTADIVSAITDAVNNGANVISLSLGGGSCNNGVDDDSAEQGAITYALQHNVIVVAAAGNGGNASVDAPACDSGVIAVGASALDDGKTTGTTNYTTTRAAGATATAPVEYVPSYSQYSPTGNTLRSATAWGIVAPGGDPSDAEASNSGTVDDLHWIENIWTSTPFGGATGDTNFTGNCQPDYNALTGTGDCRTLIAGTSMSTPHVAGAVALILAVNSAAYGTPAAMKALLCSTADNLGDTHQGCGRLNLYVAMATAMGDTSPPTPSP